MAIATLIAAGRLDDRLVDRALGLLARGRSQGRLRALDRRGGCRRPRVHRRHQGRALGARGARSGRCGRPAGRTALAATVRRRHGFDHHRPGMHRRARRLCRSQGQGRADHRASDAGRTRFFGGAAGTGATARRARPGRARALPRRTCARDGGRGDAGPDDARGRRQLPAGVGRVPVVRRAHRAAGGVRPRQGQPTGVRRRQIKRRSRRPDRRCYGQARRAHRGPRPARAQARKTYSPLAMAPTTS